MSGFCKYRYTFHAVVFVLSLFTIVAARRILPYESLKDGNLLVNVVLALLTTLLAALAGKVLRTVLRR